MSESCINGVPVGTGDIAVDGFTDGIVGTVVEVGDKILDGKVDGMEVGLTACISVGRKVEVGQDTEEGSDDKEEIGLTDGSKLGVDDGCVEG